MADVKISALPAGTAAPGALIPAVNAAGTTTQKITVQQIVDLATASMPSGTVNTVGNPVGLTQDPALPIQKWAEEMVLKAAFVDNMVGFARVDVRGAGDIGDATGGDGWVASSAGFFGTLYYGALGSRAAGDPPGYELPTPTEQGYLRADQDPASGWYFAEPFVVSDTEPPTPPGSPAIPTLWIDPTGTPPEYIYSNSNPPVSTDPPIMETATSPLGIVNNTYIEPDVVGAVPVVVDGKRYLLPLLEAPASAALRVPLFTFADAPVKQQSDGSWIGFDDTGMAYYQPETIAAVPVLVAGKKYLLPLISE